MAIHLPDQDYYTLRELIQKWGCQESDVRRLILRKTLVPSYVIHDVARLVVFDKENEDGRIIWVPREVPNDVDDPELLRESPVKMIWVAGFYYLVHPYQSGPLDCSFALFSPNRDHDQASGAPCFMIRARQPPLSLDEVIQNGAAMRDEVERVEGELGGLSVGRSDALPEVAYLDPADLPEELDIANLAFRAVSNGYGDPLATFKQRLISYLRENYLRLSEEQVRRISTLANPDKMPGRRGGQQQ